jgi:hypothetical protein
MPRPNRFDRQFPALVQDAEDPTPPQAPADLTRSQRKIFDAVVAENPHLQQSDVTLLTTYVQLVETTERLGARVAKDGPIFNGKVASWFTAWQQSSRTLLIYSRELLLLPAEEPPEPKPRKLRTGWNSPEYLQTLDRLTGSS